MDKSLVGAVAALLGRHRAVYDKWNIEAGDAIVEALRREINVSDLFVLFASKAALASPWVQEESRLAQAIAIQRNRINVLVLVIHETVVQDEIPLWLRAYNMVPARNAHEAAFRINRSLTRLANAGPLRNFIGRSDEYAELESAIIESPSSGYAFAISGYRGLGRASLADETGRRFFRLQESIVLAIDEGQTLRETLAQLAEYTSSARTGAELIDIVRGVESSDEDRLMLILSDYLERIFDTSRLLILRDDGGIVDSDGMVSSEIRPILDFALAERRLNVALVTRRAITDGHYDIPNLRLRAMKDSDMRSLLTLLTRRWDSGGTVDSSALTDLVEFIGGYPPGAYMASQLMSNYGVDYLRKDKRRLSDFQARSLISELQRDQILAGARQEILRLLVAYSPLPLVVLEESLSATGYGDASDDLVYLIDFGLVVVDMNGYYALSNPLVEAVSRTLAFQSIDHKALAIRLKRYVDESEGNEPSAQLYRVLYRAVSYSGAVAGDPLMLGLVSDMDKLQQRTYHVRRYDDSIQYGTMVVGEREHSVRARSYLAKAYAQVGRFDEAREIAAELHRRGRRADAAYLRAFILRKESRLREALGELETAIGLGRTDVSAYRDLAFIKLTLDDVEGASEAFAMAMRQDPENPHVTDLRVQLALRLGQMDRVDELMPVLEKIDRREHYRHRESDVAYVKAQYDIAYEKALESIDLENPPLYFFSQLIKTEIQLRKFESAEARINKLDEDFPYLHQDIKIGLRVSLWTRQGRYVDALGSWQRLRDKKSLIARLLKRNILHGMASSLDIANPRRAEIESEIRDLKLSEPELKLVQ